MLGLSLLKHLGKALVRQIGNGLGFGVLGDVIVDCGEEVWDKWRQEKNEPQRRAELEAITRLAAQDVRDEVRRLAGDHGPVCCAAFLPDGRHLLAGEWDHRLRL